MLDARHGGRRDAQLIHPEPQQQQGKIRLPGHLTADPHPEAVPMRRLNGHLDQPQHRRMRRLVKMRDAVVEPVNRQRVLDQIVGPDAEEPHMTRQTIRHDDRRGNFDHRPNLHRLVKRKPLPAQLRATVVQKRVGLLQFLHTRNHRVHELHVPMRARSEDRTQLGPEKLLPLETEPDRAPSQERIHLLRHLQVRNELVTPDVQGADDRRVRPGRLRHRPVGLILRLLVRHGIPLQEKIFGAKQTHAFRSRLPDRS